MMSSLDRTRFGLLTRGRQPKRSGTTAFRETSLRKVMTRLGLRRRQGEGEPHSLRTHLKLSSDTGFSLTCEAGCYASIICEIRSTTLVDRDRYLYGRRCRSATSNETRMGVGQHWHKPVDRDEVKSLEGGTYSGAV